MKLDRNQLRDLELTHTALLDSFVNGPLTVQHVHALLATVKLWHVVAVWLGRHKGIMGQQVQLAERMVQELAQGELQVYDTDCEIIKLGVQAMVQLAREVTQPQASTAADVAERTTNQYLQEVYYRHKDNSSKGRG